MRSQMYHIIRYHNFTLGDLYAGICTQLTERYKLVSIEMFNYSQQTFHKLFIKKKFLLRMCGSTLVQSVPFQGC
jgi:hypothetical protein